MKKNEKLYVWYVLIFLGAISVPFSLTIPIDVMWGALLWSIIAVLVILWYNTIKVDEETDEEVKP